MTKKSIDQGQNSNELESSAVRDGQEAAPAAAAKGDRLQKVLAQAGLGSRRELERWISEGRVKVNGELATLGDRVVASDKIYIDDRPVKLPLRAEQEYKVIVFSKPEGVVCTHSDPEGRPTVFDHLPKLEGQRWISVGRLDINTSGLLLLTTDGELANRLMHPSYGVDREYAVRVHGEVDEAMITRLKDGVLLEDGLAKFTDVQEYGGEGRNKWFHVVVMEGRNREVRRLWESQEVQVSRLKRVRYGCIFMPSRLKVGAWEELKVRDINDLRALVDMPPIAHRQKSSQELVKEKRAHTKSVKKGIKRARRPVKKR